MIADPRRARQEALAAALAAEELEGLLVTSRANIRYLTGFSGSAAIVAVTRGDVLLVTDFRYDEQARAEAGAVARIEVESTSVWDRFFQALATLGPLTVVGYEAHVLSVEGAERWAVVGFRRSGRRRLPARHAHGRGGRAGHGAAAGCVRARGRGATAGARVCAGGHERARRGCACARRDRSARFRRGVRPLARARAGARGARGAAPVQDQCGPVGRW